jgi:hypothetical protein
MGFMFNLADYETVDSRIHQFYESFKDGRIVTEMELIDIEKGHCVFKAYIYKDSVRTMPDSTGYADGFRKDRGVDAQFWINNAETSSIGRALANLGLSAKGKRPSAEEMAQVNVVKTKKPDVEKDYWTTPFGEQDEYIKKVPAPATMEDAVNTVANILGADKDTPHCSHGAMVWKTGQTKAGKPWGHFKCSGAANGEMARCPKDQDVIWYEIKPDGSWGKQKVRA